MTVAHDRANLIYLRHGHDFSLLKQAPLSASGDYDLSDVNFNSPMRRDVAVLPGKGYIVIGFETDNPGSWIMVS